MVDVKTDATHQTLYNIQVGELKRAKLMKRYSAPSVKKAFAILSAISSSPEGLGVSGLAKNLKIAKSTVHGMTSALEELGAVMRDPLTKKYKLGFTLLEIGRSAYTQVDLKTSARPVMASMVCVRYCPTVRAS